MTQHLPLCHIYNLVSACNRVCSAREKSNMVVCASSMMLTCGMEASSTSAWVGLFLILACNRVYTVLSIAWLVFRKCKPQFCRLCVNRITRRSPSKSDSSAYMSYKTVTLMTTLPITSASCVWHKSSRARP